MTIKKLAIALFLISALFISLTACNGSIQSTDQTISTAVDSTVESATQPTTDGTTQGTAQNTTADTTAALTTQLTTDTTAQSMTTQSTTAGTVYYDNISSDPIGLPVIVGAADQLIFLRRGINALGNYKITYIDYEQFFLQEGETQPDSGRYANVTADGEINWDYGGWVRFEQTPQVVDMLEQLTLDGQNVHLPMQFKDLGDQYAVFDKVDFSKAIGQTYSFTIIDKKTGNKISYFGGDDITETGQVVLLDKNDNFIIRLTVNFLNNEIEGLYTDLSHYLSQRDLRINGIGCSNTLNEMYNAFGKPNKFASDDTYMPEVTYYYVDEEKNLSYMVQFNYYNTIHDHRTGQEGIVKNSTITSVTAYIGTR